MKIIIMEDIYSILIFVAFIIYSLYKRSKKAANKATPQPQAQRPPQGQPVKELFESLFGEDFNFEQEVTPPNPVEVPSKSYRGRFSPATKEYSSPASEYFKPKYDDLNRPKISSLKTIVRTDTKSTENMEPSIIASILQNDGHDLRKAILYQTVLERPYS
jgi:hypothetical protein